MTSNYGGTVAEGSKALAAIWSENKLKPKDPRLVSWPGLSIKDELFIHILFEAAIVRD